MRGLPLSEEQLREAVDLRAQHRSVTEAALAAGIARKTFSDRLVMAARRGIAPGHFEHGVAPGFLMGKVTVQRGAEGQVERTWERQSPDREQMFEAIRTALEDLTQQVQGLAPITPEPGWCDEDLLTVIPMGDPHFGLLTWARETGDAFDLDIGERLTFAAVDRLASLTPPSGRALLLNLGDYFHADNGTNRTPQSGNPLDVDGRFPKIASVGFRAMIRCVRRLLEKHRVVYVRNNPGNHDPHQAAMLTIAVQAYFHDEPRVIVEDTPSAFYFHRFGKQLIGSTHGDGPKLAELPLIMANDAPQDWAASEFRVWHCGHVHHDQIKELVGCTVETHRTLASGDAWHRWKGYRAGRDMKAIVYHREYGEDVRIRCGPERLPG